MDGKEQEMVLLEIQKQLGKVDATTTAIKDDIAELKQKDISQTEELEEAYAKAKARQDSIRDDLQHQIDGNKTLILTVSESINTLNRNIDKLFKDFSSSVEDKLSSFNKRLDNLETKKEKTLVKWWDKILDKVIWIFVAAAIVVLLKWLNAPPEIMNQLPH
jgi:archaellum component FlaC